MALIHIYACIYLHSTGIQLEWLASSLPSVRANGLQALIFFSFPFFFFPLFLLIRRLLHIRTSAWHGKRKGGKTVHIPTVHHGRKIHPGNPSLLPLSLPIKEGSLSLFEELNLQGSWDDIFVSQPSSCCEHFKGYHIMEEKVLWEKGVLHGKNRSFSFKTQSGTDLFGVHWYPTHL